MPIIAPNIQLAKEFENKVRPLYKEWTNRIHECLELTLQRNELLTLLMTGQVSVKQLNNDLASSKKDTQCVHFWGLFRQRLNYWQDMRGWK